MATETLLTPVELERLSPTDRTSYLVGLSLEDRQAIYAANQTAKTATPVAKSESTQGPLTRPQAIQLVKQWVAQDDQYGDPTPFEEFLEKLLDVADTTESEIPTSELKEIVAQHAPNAPHRTQESVKLQSGSMKQSKGGSYPPELEPLIKSGIAELNNTAPGGVVLNRCIKCGEFKTKCCGTIEYVTAVRDDDNTLTKFGRQALTLESIPPPKPPKTSEELKKDKLQRATTQAWWMEYRGTNQLEGNTNLRMYIENFLPEGVTLICGLPKEGKSFLALAIAKALTSGQPLFGKLGYEVPEAVPVLYLAAESGDSGLKMRCEKFDITNDKTMFLARTLSMGPMIKLDDENLAELIRTLKPVIILETLIRFNDGKDEDSATENRKLAESLFRLIGLGARAVVAIHHSRKDLDKKNPSKESAARGSGDVLAMADVVWLVMQDASLHQGGAGPNEVDIQGWGRDFNPTPFRLALTRKAKPEDTRLFTPGIVSHIDTMGNLWWVGKGRKARKLEFQEHLEKLITENPGISLEELIERTGQSEWNVRKTLKQLGYAREKGDAVVTKWLKKSD